MPSGPLSPTRVIVASVLALEPRAVVDLGMGTGKYGFLIREQTDLALGRLLPEQRAMRIVGVEGWADYIGDHQRAVYDEIVVGDALDHLRSCKPGEFDVALAIDVIEHFPPEQAVEFLAAALSASRYVVVSTPRSFYPQGDEANALQRHLSWWPAKALRRAAHELSAIVAIHHDRLAVVAMLSRNGQPRLVTDLGLAARNAIRSALIPETVYCRLRHKAGPSLL